MSSDSFPVRSVVINFAFFSSAAARLSSPLYAPSAIITDPNANSRYTTESLMHLMAFDVDDRMDLVDQPLLMMAGDIADTKYMTDSAFEKAVNAKSKELFLIEGATHIRTYWVPEYVEKAASKLKVFLAENLYGGN